MKLIPSILLFTLVCFSLNVFSQNHKINLSKKKSTVRIKEFPTQTLEDLLRLNEVENKVDEVLKLNPNPTTGVFSMHFTCAKNQTVTLSILDLKGQLFYTKNYTVAFTSNTVSVTDAKLKKGIYILKLCLEEDEVNRKLIVY